MKRPQYESDKNLLRIHDLTTNDVTTVTEDLDLSLASLEWSLKGSETLYVTAQYRGANRIFRLRLDSQGRSVSSVGVLRGDETRSSPLIVPYNQHQEGLYFLETSLTSPNELILLVLEGDGDDTFIPFHTFHEAASPVHEGEVKLISTAGCGRNRYQIYNPTPEFSNGDVVTPQVSSHYLRGGGGELVHAWYVAPPSAHETHETRENGSVPLLLIIHGGPQGAILNSWHYRWNLGIFAAMGYGVVAVNFHGSTGFGQGFVDSIRGDWGGKPYEDCLAAVEYVLGQHSYLDRTRVGALGASYGGYMINWINGHSDRFSCLVNHDGIFSLRSLYYTTEELYFPEYEFGLPWENPETNDYAKFGPDNFVANWKTPTLVIQGGVDFRVGEAESLSTFTALQRRGIPSKLLYFPDENHWVMRPQNSIKWHATIKEWLATWLQQDK